MKRDMAVWTHGDKVLYRVDFMFAPGSREGRYVVHLDDSGELRTVCARKVKATDRARGSMDGKARFSRGVAPLVAIERDLRTRSL